MTPAPSPAPSWRKGLPPDADAVAHMAPCNPPCRDEIALFLGTVMTDGNASLLALDVWVVIRDGQSGALLWFERRHGRWAVASRERAAAYSFVPVDQWTCLPVPWRRSPAPEPCPECKGMPRGESLSVPVCICGAAEMGV